jgi:hypothetical protein
MQPASNEEAEGQLLEKGNSLKQIFWSLWAEQSLIKYTATKKIGFSNFQKLINTFWGSIG